ncbi:MAG: PEGA domain-containing protein [Pirellulales bacterium]|nr:PEGA domain-containing protein [Pirellulales bacterium]
MSGTLLALTLLWMGAEPVESSETPQTMLYVRTTPAGAVIRLGGKELGQSDGLFPVAPGKYKIIIDLEGYQPEEQQINLRKGRITRIELTLKSRAAGAGKTHSSQRRRYFVRLVVSLDGMTFEGKAVSWKELPGLFEKVPNRGQTVLELAVTSDQITYKEYEGAFARAAKLAKPLGFEYLSQIGVHPLGSKGSPPLTISQENKTPDKENLLKNPGFETGKSLPDNWYKSSLPKGRTIPGVKSILDKKVAFRGKASLCIEKTAQNYFPIAQWTQTFKREGDRPTLRLSAQVKTEDMTKAVLDVLFLDEKGKWISHHWIAYIGSKEEGDPPANHDWKEYSGQVDIPAGTKIICVGLQVYGPGKVWFDDVRASYAN